MQSQMVRMGENGRVVIPAPIREAMGLKPGAALHLSLDEEGLRIQTVRQQIARAQADCAQALRSGEVAVGGIDCGTPA